MERRDEVNFARHHAGRERDEDDCRSSEWSAPACAELQNRCHQAVHIVLSSLDIDRQAMLPHRFGSHRADACRFHFCRPGKLLSMAGAVPGRAEKRGKIFISYSRKDMAFADRLEVAYGLLKKALSAPVQ